ncbi:hypothetical protein PV325_013761, partial [Microctonus aethiopoides]
MRNIGHFETYHDLDKSSAVVYIEKENSLYGFIDMRYELIGLPVDRLDEKHIVGKSRWVIHVVDEENNSVDNNLPSTSHTHSSSPSKKRPHDDVVNDPSSTCDDSLPSFKKYQRTNLESPSISDLAGTLSLNSIFKKINVKKPLGPFYPEILLLVAHNIEINDRYKLARYDYPAKHVLYYLIYMNAVAMLFAKLAPDVEIHINIAGIIFEE